MIEVAHRALTVVDSDRLVGEQAKGMVLKGQEEEARAELDTRIKSVEEAEITLIQIAAALGDREQAESLIDDYRGSTRELPFNTLAIYAWTGDRENANRLAAEFDRHPFGHVALSISALVCECGAPWDLALTPAFAAKMAESGLPWPPLSPLSYPFKDW